jgi:hypothetical protein
MNYIRILLALSIFTTKMSVDGRHVLVFGMVTNRYITRLVRLRIKTYPQSRSFGLIHERPSALSRGTTQMGVLHQSLREKFSSAPLHLLKIIGEGLAHLRRADQHRYLVVRGESAVRPVGTAQNHYPRIEYQKLGMANDRG